MKTGVDLVLTKRFSRRCIIPVTVVSAWLLATVPAGAALFSGVVINNGVVELGVNPEGELIVYALGANVYSLIGLTYIPTGGEALAPGSPYEGWGVGDPISDVSGSALSTYGPYNMTLQCFSSTPTSAVSVVTVGGTFRVTHDYHPSVSSSLFEAVVTIENISSATVDVRYRRTMDWDIPPTIFDELVTIEGWPAANLIGSNNGGFSDPDPLVSSSPESLATVNVNFDDYGPTDQGAVFDFDLGSLAPGKTVQFKIYYGAAGSETEAMAALNNVGAEVYSLGEPNVPPYDGEPNTFIFGFSGPPAKALPVPPCVPPAPVCVQDDYSNDHIQFDLNTGEYVVTKCSSGSTLTGTGRIQQVGCITILRDTSNGRSLFAIAQVGMCGNRGLFGVIDHNSRTKIYGFDSNLTNNSCSCGQVE